MSAIIGTIVAWLTGNGSLLLQLLQTILLLLHGKQIIASNKAASQSPDSGDLVSK